MNTVVETLQDRSEIILLKFAWKVIKQCLEMLGIEPRTSYMQSMRSTTELHPRIVTNFAAYVVLQTL